jgi:2-phospho-L-lactate guanylyltransferase
MCQQMRYVLIPVKDLSRAKQRLAPLLNQEERTRLAWTMLEGTFAAASRARNADRIAVVTLYQPAIALAESYRMEVIIEAEQISESKSVDSASREAKKCGASAVLRLPIDLPLLTTEDIETILARHLPGPSAVIVPSRDGTGTNAILRSPADLFPSHFGPGSLAKHLQEAEQAQARCEIIHLPRLALDIDEAEDVAVLMEQGAGTPAYELLTEMRIHERLPALNRSR